MNGMSNDDFIANRGAWTVNRFEACDAKSIEYTRGNLDDRLCNFTRIADLLGLSWEEVWAVYFTKHSDALIQWVKTGLQGTEGIQSRMDDMQNYLDLLRAHIEANPVPEDDIPY